MMTTTLTLEIEMESPLFQTTQPQEAEDYAKQHACNVYTWKTTGRTNWLEKGFAKSDTLALVALPNNLPDTIHMPDDPDTGE